MRILKCLVVDKADSAHSPLVDVAQDEADAMDDDAMFEMDALLGRAFKSARLDRTAAKATSEALVHFKFRTCTLLDIFMR